MSIRARNVSTSQWEHQQYSSSTDHLLSQVEQLRVNAIRALDARRKLAYGQFFTPPPVATRMAAMLNSNEVSPHILDAGAGVGSLFAACVAQLCEKEQRPRTIRVTAYEVDPFLAESARTSLRLCEHVCFDAGVAFVGEVVEADFLERSLSLLGRDLFAQGAPSPITNVILNPPYRKIAATSRERKLLRQAGIEATNLYVGFLELAIRLLPPGGTLVSITPRSFCNGAYFKSFRRSLLKETNLCELHLFDSRHAVFGDDVVGQQVLQESIILSARKRMRDDRGPQASPVRVTLSDSADDRSLVVRDVPFQQIVRPNDQQSILHISPDDPGRPVNSGQTVYQIEVSALALVRQFGSITWQDALDSYLSTVTTLKQRYAKERLRAPNKTSID